MVAVLLIAAGGAGGLWWMVQQKQQPDEQPTQANAGVAGAQPAQAAQPLPDSDTAGGAPESPAAASVAGAPSATQPETPAQPAAETPPSPPPAQPTPDADFVFRVPAPGEALDPIRGLVDSALIRLDQVPPLGKWHGSSDEEWTTVVEDLTLYLDNSGARSNRAGDRLVEAGRHAVPAIINGMMKQDFTTLDGVKMAGSLNDLLKKIGKGTNLGWETAEVHPLGSAGWEKAVLLQKKTVASWQRFWVLQLSVNDAQWEGFSKKFQPKTEQDPNGIEPPANPF